MKPEPNASPNGTDPELKTHHMHVTRVWNTSWARIYHASESDAAINNSFFFMVRFSRDEMIKAERTRERDKNENPLSQRIAWLFNRNAFTCAEKWKIQTMKSTPMDNTILQ